uniref:Uncharacterized protein n=1 Tax=Trypanosoma congolense (strain IL3000) TaxID=1068625 RepID=G0UQP5_TRYCI|nr:conserved hypothetical protein [Trypanosoma congolense IL3000]
MGCGSSVFGHPSVGHYRGARHEPLTGGRRESRDRFMSIGKLFVPNGCSNSLSSHTETRPTITSRRPSTDVQIEEEDILSDISSIGSASWSLLDAHPLQAGVTTAGAWDLEQQRRHMSHFGNENLFIYDDVVVVKSDANAEALHLNGHRPSFPLQYDRAGNRRPSSGRSKGGSVFCFADFKVCVDEVEDETNGEADASGKRRLSILRSGYGDVVLKGAKVSCASSARPDTLNLLRERMAAQREVANKQPTRSVASRDIRRYRNYTLIGHSGRIRCLSFAPNEKTLVSCSNQDSSVVLRRVANGEDTGVLSGHQDVVMCTAFSPDGKYLATGSKDKALTIWDATITKMLLVVKHDKAVVCCCFSPDSRRIVTGCQDRVCRVWDVHRGSQVITYSRHSGIIMALAYSPGGGHICSASADRTLRVWGADRGGTQLTLSGHVGVVRACSYSTNSTWIFSNDEAFLFVWSTKDGSCALRISVAEFVTRCGHNFRIRRLGWTLSCAAPGPFTNYVMVACTNRFVYLIDVRTGEEFVSIFCKASVDAMTRGKNSRVAFGDAFGNVYIQEFM